MHLMIAVTIMHPTVDWDGVTINDATISIRMYVSIKVNDATAVFGGVVLQAFKKHWFYIC